MEYIVGVTSDQEFAQLRIDRAAATRRAILDANGGVWPLCPAHDYELDDGGLCDVCESARGQWASVMADGRV